MDYQNVLNKRYLNNGIPRLRLNPVQLDQKRKIQKHIDNRDYHFEEVDCLVCSGHDFDPLSEKDRYGLYMPVAICRDCGLVQASPRLTQESYNHFYNDGHRRLYVGREKPDETYFQSRYPDGDHCLPSGKKLL